MTKISKEEAQKRLKKLQKEKEKLEKEKRKDKTELEQELIKVAKSNLITFVQLFWNLSGGKGDFKKLWHAEAICEHLEALYNLEVKKLAINVQPRLGKSTICSTLYPVWIWLQEPDHQFISASYGHDLAKRDAQNSRGLIKSSYFQKCYGHLFQLSGKNLEHRYENNYGGRRVATTPTGAGTGEGADSLIIDDPHKAGDAKSEKELETVRNWFDTTISNRYNNPEKFRILLIHQRLAENDLIGHIKEIYNNELCHLNLPCEYEGDKSKTFLGWQDPRTKKGQLIAPELFNKRNAETEKLKGNFYWFTQYQQNPTPDVGGILKEEFLQFYDSLPSIKNFDLIFTSWDLAEGKEINTDTESERCYTVGQVWGVLGKRKFLIDQFRDKVSFIEQKEEFLQLEKKYPEIAFHLIEKKSNGVALINHFENQVGVSSVVEIKPKKYGKDKEERFNLSLPNFHGKEVILPNPKIYPRFTENKKELLSFPKAKYDDTVDATTQALNYLNLNYSPSETIVPNEDFKSDENTHKMFNLDDFETNIKQIRDVFSF